MTTTDERTYFTIAEAADLLGWTEDQVWEAVETDILPAVAPAYWGQPEQFDYRYAPGRVMLAIRAAGVDEINWLFEGPPGPARFPAQPANVRLLAEFVIGLVLRNSKDEDALVAKGEIKEERIKRLLARTQELRTVGVKAWHKQTADEEGISPSRLKELLRGTTTKPAPTSIAGQLAPIRRQKPPSR